MTIHVSAPAVPNGLPWARALINEAVAEHGRVLPSYGSRAWERLPARQKWAAVLIAAEAWRIDSLPTSIALRFASELEAENAASKHLADLEYVATAREWRRAWSWLSWPGVRPRPEILDDLDDPEGYVHDLFGIPHEAKEGAA